MKNKLSNRDKKILTAALDGIFKLLDHMNEEAQKYEAFLKAVYTKDAEIDALVKKARKAKSKAGAKVKASAKAKPSKGKKK